MKALCCQLPVTGSEPVMSTSSPMVSSTNMLTSMMSVYWWLCDI